MPQHLLLHTHNLLLRYLPLSASTPVIGNDLILHLEERHTQRSQLPPHLLHHRARRAMHFAIVRLHFLGVLCINLGGCLIIVRDRRVDGASRMVSFVMVLLDIFRAP